MDSEVEPLACDPLRVLVADDEATLRHLFSKVISSGLPSVQIDLACNGIDAVSAFQLAHHRVILMDLKMPGMDGVQAAEAIRTFCRANNWQTPAVVFCTGFAPPDSLKAFVCKGQPHAVLRKPVTNDQVVNAVKAAFAARG